MKLAREVFLFIILYYILFTNVSGDLASIIMEGGNEDISREISGTYQHLDLHSLTGESSLGQKCALSLNLDVVRNYNQLYTLKLPKALYDPSGACRPHLSFEDKEVKLVDYGKTLSILTKFTKSKVDDTTRKVYMMASLPQDSLMCPAGSPFETLILASMKDSLAAVLRSQLKEIGISPSIISKIFEPPTNDTVWGAPIIRSMNSELQKTFAKFKGTYVMLLVRGFSTSQVMAETTTAIDVSARTLKGIADKTCTYLTGPLTFGQVVQIVYEVTDILYPLLSGPVYTPINFSTRQFFTGSQTCSVIPSNSVALQVLSFSKTPTDDLVPGAFAMGTEVSVSVNGNNNCAKTVFSRLLEAESNMGKSEYGVAILDRIKNLMENLDSSMEQSTGLYLGGILADIFKAQAKSIVSVAVLDIQQCSGFSNVPPITMIYFKKPTKTFLCTDQKTDKANCLNIRRDSIALGSTNEESGESETIFLANASVDEECVLSTSTVYEGTLKRSQVTEKLLETPEASSVILSGLRMTHPVAVQ